MSMRRILPAIVAFLIVTALGRAENPAEPSILVRFSSLHDLVSDIKFIARLEQGGDVEAQIDKGIESLFGADYAGIDTKQPGGIICMGDANADPQPLALIPVANEKRFLELLQRFFGAAEKDKEGIYRFANGNFFRIVIEKGYVFAGEKDDTLKSRPDPKKALAYDHTGSLLFRIRLDQLNGKARESALMFPKQFWGTPIENSAEPELIRKLRKEVAASANKLIESVLKEGKEIVAQFAIDRKTEEIAIDWKMTAKPDTSLAKTFAQLGNTQSRFAALPALGSAMGLQLHWILPADLTEAVRPTIDEAIRRVMLNAPAETVRRNAAQVADALDPTLRSGELDAGIRLLGPSKDSNYTLVLGMRLKEGLKIDGAVRSLIKSLPESDQEKFKFDAARIGGTPIHRADVHHDFNETFIAIFGGNPIYYSIRADAFWLAIGPDAQGALKQSIAAGPQKATPFDYELSFARLGGLMSTDKEMRAVLARAADEAFGKTGNKDTAQIRVEGGETLRVRFAIKAPIVRYLKEAGDRHVRPYWLFWWW